MNTKEMTREQISAFADGELVDHKIDGALDALCNEQLRADWDIYHQIGDVMRSDDMAINLSSGFAARMAARLDAEPTIGAPAAVNNLVNISSSSGAVGSRSRKRWAVPGMVAAAAMAAVAFVTTPQLMVAMKGDSTTNPSILATADSSTQVGVGAADRSESQGLVVATSAPEGVVLRDSRIDDYLLAHQRFSPSLYSTAQYARSATFATDFDK
ncbi:MAG TPA: sigma-E factor negative regulatory protein [Noviherbaspirillum sp.]|nr:sigma-E factor negative regulatory protein [Noviherbaspirillum sp.]